MRKLIGMAVVAGLVAVGGFASSAMAGAALDLVFIEKNGGAIAATDTVTAAAGDTLLMALVMHTDIQLSAYGFSLNYDLDGDNELDVVSATQWSGVPLNAKASASFTPLGALAPSTSTFVGSFNATNNVNTLNLFLPANAAPGYTIGTVVWHVNAGVNTDGADIISGFLNPGVDGLGDSSFNLIDNQALFHGATVNSTVIPEPGTAGLLGFGLVGLILAGRRSRA
jgi:hypothetical protein